MSNHEGRREVDAANERLVVAKKRLVSSSQLLGAAAKTVGFAQLAALNVQGAGKTLIDSASETMELAQCRANCFEQEFGEAEKDLRIAQQNWEKVRVYSGTFSNLDSNGSLGRAIRPTANAQCNKRRLVDDSGAANGKYNGGSNGALLKKSKVAKAIVPKPNYSATQSASAPAFPSPGCPNPFTSKAAGITSTPFSFGSAYATLPAETFLFGRSKSAVATAADSSYTHTSAKGTASTSPAGKRKLSSEDSAGEATQAQKEVQKPRKIVKASRKWRNDNTTEVSNEDSADGANQAMKHRKIVKARRKLCNGKTTGEATDGEKIAPMPIFASLKLAPSTAAETEKWKEGNDGAAPSASAKPAFSFAAPSSSTDASSTEKAFNDRSEQGPGGTSKPDKAKQVKNVEEETLYEVRAKHLKAVDNDWIKHGAGVLRLLRHRQTSKCRIVIRNPATGKVQFNVGILKGMAFQKVIKETDKGKSAYVRFGAVEGGSKMETFMLQVKHECADKLHETLEGMAK